MSNPLGGRCQDKLMAICSWPSINYTPVKYTMPLPYPVWRMLDNSTNTRPTVKFNEEECYTLDTTVQPDCFGDFPGQGKGIFSETVSDEVRPIESSDSIYMEGELLVRKGDACTLNHGNTKGKYTDLGSVLSGLAHFALGALSFLPPPAGTIAAVADIGLCLLEGDGKGAVVGLAALVPCGLGKAATGIAKFAGKALSPLTKALKFTKGGAWIKGFAKKATPCILGAGLSLGLGFAIPEFDIPINFGFPVHAIRGAKTLMGEEDLDYQGTGYLPFYLQRLYNSQNPNIGWFGQGWRAQGYEQYLDIKAQQDTINLIDNSGREIPFTYLTPGQSCYNPYEDITLYRLPHSEAEQKLTLHSQPIEANAERGSRIGEHEPLRFILYDGKHKPKSADYSDYDGIAQHFSHVKSRNNRHTRAVVLPSKQTDRYGHTLHLHYTHDANSKLAHLPQHITDANGNCYQLTFDFIDEHPRLKHLHQIHNTDNTSKTTTRELATYHYNKTGDLTQIKRHGKVLREFDYNNHLITWQKLPTGLEANYTYDQTDDAKTARVITHTISNGQHYQFDYINAKDSKDGLNHSIVTEQPGTEYERTHYYTYDDWYILKQYTNPQGHSYTLSHDHLDRIIKIQNPKGGHSLFQRIGNHLTNVRIQTGTDPITQLPTYRSTRYQYNHNKLVIIQDALGNSQRLNYNNNGEIASYTDAQGNTTTYDYDKHGNITKHTLANGSSYTYHYNENGELTHQTDCSGYKTQYIYDEKQRLTAIINAKGEQTRYTYDNSKPWYDLINHVDYPDGSHIHLDYDDVGRLIKHTDAKQQTTEYEYSNDSLPTRRIDALGHSLDYHYDPLRRLAVLTNENGEDWTFTYDKGDNLISETRFDNHQSDYRYDELGDLKVQIDNPNLPKLKQRHVHYQRDLIGQLIAKHAVHYPQAIGEQANQSKSIQIKPEYHRTRFKYDIAGQLISAANGNSRTELVYDKLGQLTRETITSHNQIHGKHKQHSQTLTHSYDQIGNRIATTLPDGKVINQAYYGSGHLYNQNISDEHGKVTEIRHSERNELHQEITRYQGSLISAFDYDPMGRLTKQYSSTDKHIAIERNYSYDKLGQLTHISGQTRLGTITPSSKIAHQFKRNHQYHYDKIGRLTQHLLTDYENHTGTTEVFAFDPASNRVPVSTLDKGSDNNKNIHKSGRPTELTTHNSYITYTYDSHGRVLYKTKTPLGSDGKPLKQSGKSIVGYLESHQFYYNANNELTQSISITQEGLNLTEVTTTYQYDAFGRRISKHSQIKEKSKRVSKNVIKFAKNHIQQQKTKHQHIQYLWDGNRQIQEQTDTHVFTTIYEQNSFEPVARLVWLHADLLQSANDEIIKAERESWEPEPELIPNIQVYHYHNDHLGTPNELTNQDGEVVWLADYEAWGNTAKVVWREEKLGKLKVSVEELQPIRFQGQSFDVETGLHYNRFRYFDPDLGMFISRDPIGLMGGNNVFQYAPNPIGWVDPWGLSCVKNQHFESRRSALRAIKRDAGIPMAQRPEKVTTVPLTDKNRKQIMINNKPVTTREYHYTTPEGKKLIIQEHSAGHIYGPKGTAGNQGPHFNPRVPEIDKNSPDFGNGSRKESFPGLSEHYSWGDKDV